MGTPLKRVNLMLDEPLVARLKKEARKNHLSMSELVRVVLGRELAPSPEPGAALQRIRALRQSFGRMPDSVETIRKDRDRGW